MEDNHPNEPADPEYDSIKGLIPGLEDSPEDEPEEEIKKEDPNPDEPEATDPDPEEEEEEQVIVDPKPEDKKEESPNRPEKYIPVQKYTSEKAEWKTERETLMNELEEAKASKGVDKEDAIKAYAEKHEVSEDSVRDLLGLFGKGDEKSEKKTEQILDEHTQARLDKADELEAEKMFEEEFNTLALPKLKTLYPKASEAQLRAAQKELEKISTTSEFLSTPLDKIVLASQEELAPLMGEKPSRKGPETGRQAPKRGDTDYTADDFKGGKTSFAELMQLPVEQQTKIIDDMDMPTYDSYSRYIQRNEPVVINRGGRKVRS